MIKANNLAISVPIAKCNKNCPYCISKMTGSVENDFEYMNRNIQKVRKIANASAVNNVMLTGKSEPLLVLDETITLIENFSDFPIEIQTNGIEIKKDPKLLDILYLKGVDIISFSIDKLSTFSDFEDIFKKIKQFNLLSRVSINVSDMLELENGRFPNFRNLIDICNDYNVDQLTLRKITIPEDPQDTKAVKWIIDHKCYELYDLLLSQAKYLLLEEGKHIRSTNYGTNIYDIRGISYSYSDYCIQERSESYDVRSLIFMNDGHLYTSWNSKASILF